VHTRGDRQGSTCAAAQMRGGWAFRRSRRHERSAGWRRGSTSVLADKASGSDSRTCGSDTPDREMAGRPFYDVSGCGQCCCSMGSVAGVIWRGT
jgi:hypothetical protein